MYHRLIITALAITYLFCVLLIGGIEKDDLDKNTLSKLQRYNVNIEDLNNGTKYQECMAKLKVDNINNMTKNQETISQNINKSENHTEQAGNKLTILTKTEVIQDVGIVETTTPERVTETVSTESNTENTDDMTKMFKLYNDFQIIKKNKAKKENNNFSDHTQQAGNKLTILTKTEVIQDVGIVETTTHEQVTETVSTESNTENTDDMTKMFKLYNDFQIIQKNEAKKEKNTIKSAIEEILKHKPDTHNDNNKRKVINEDTIQKAEKERPVEVQEKQAQEEDRITSKPPKTTSEPGGTISNSQLANVNFKNFWEMYSTFQEIKGIKEHMNNPKTSDPTLLPKSTDNTNSDISGTSLRRNNDNDNLITSQVMDLLSKQLAQKYINERNKQTTITPMMDDVMVQIKNFIDAKSRGEKTEANVLIPNPSDTSSKTLALNSETLDYVRFIKPPDRDLVIDITYNNSRSRFVSNTMNPKQELGIPDRDVTTTPTDEAGITNKPNNNKTSYINKSRGATDAEGSKISIIPQETLQDIINLVKNKIIRDLKEEIFYVTPISTTVSTTTMTMTTKTTTTTESPKLEEFSEAKILFENFSHLFEKIKKMTSGSSNETKKYDNVTKKEIMPESANLPNYDNNSVKQTNFIQNEIDVGPIPRTNAVVPYPVPPTNTNSQPSFDPYQMGNDKIEIPALPSYNIQQSKNPYGFSNPQSPAINYMQQSLKVPTLQRGFPNSPTPYLGSLNQRAKPAYSTVVEPNPVAQQRNSFLTMSLQTQSRSHSGTQLMGYPNPLINAPILSQNDGLKRPKINTLKSYTNSIANSNLKMIELPQPEQFKQVAITIQTNSGEIQPLGIPIKIDTGKSLSRLVQNQNIIVTTERPRGSRPKIPPIPIGIEERYDAYKYLGPRVISHTHEEVKPKFNARHRSRPTFAHQNLEEFSANKESYTPSYIDRSYMPNNRDRSYKPSHRVRSHTPSYRDYSYEYTPGYRVRPYTPSHRDRSDEYTPTHRSRPNYRHNPGRYDRNENEERTPEGQLQVSAEVEQPRIKKNYPNRYEQREPRHRETPYRDRVANSAEEPMSRPSRISSRQQMPLKARPKYNDDTHFKNFIQTQQKVNAMLENILSKSSKPKSYRDDTFSN